MRIAVLDLCVWLPEYQSDQAKFGALLAAWASRDLPEADFTVVDVVQGAPLPPPDDYDGYIISGSDKGVYDDTPWMQPLRDWLIDARDAGKPMFGVCFGHQIMADVFGGKAEKIGAAEVGVRAFDIDGQKVTGHVWHQDQVTEIPPGATVIGKADYCPVAALAYDFPAMSVQFHPEYAPDYVSTFLRRSRGKVLSEEVTDKAVAELDASDVSADLFAKQVGEFFRGAIPT
ncbi:class I glutamine amidotransferase domain-containing protein [Sulfitobacter noctilucicola]|uniref:GMP synthase-like glutamine amidotransferase n=1 Tax=Sulfitobacter noctilucicola TaxID=1342301 RepID=A0A7W6MBQ0_9RHOB|nr:type 1 glutamine amidotransferase [Sulfitobacter noctilucicola]KIN70225.1 class I glutamine amidotransferase domain-containing protein [Sulfitobacter noctilucicola]MBB4176128.1 GMP synthase-like glutamine amidotransferase [Sulfitobacter noctilucicola]